MAPLGLTALTVLLTILAVKCGTWGKRMIVACFWAAYTVVSLVFAGVLL